MTTTSKPRESVLDYPRTLYPPIQPYKEHRLKVSDIHELYVEESGNPQGNPILFVHGGPGGGCSEWYRQFCDPQAYRIIMFDQRGCGKSTPLFSLQDNTTWHLVDDIEKIRKHLGIDRWAIFGGSWGSTLALAYAETHPTVVKCLILRGIFTLRREELLFFYQKGSNYLFPDYFDEYLSVIPEVERGDLMSAYYRRLTNDNDKETQMKCAQAWTRWEMATSRLMVDDEKIKEGEDPAFALAFARIECHYFVNGGFFKEEGQLLKNATILNQHNIPGVIIQGRYDVVCPATTAWELSKVWTNSDLKIIADSGHSMSEPDNIRDKGGRTTAQTEYKGAEKALNFICMNGHDISTSPHEINRSKAKVFICPPCKYDTHVTQFASMGWEVVEREGEPYTSTREHVLHCRGTLLDNEVKEQVGQELFGRN
ncbi:Proline iminopeptidase [Cavenderia fasciculata]|uniref:Proline iminopeptidase n=1 Tax=Cavenderia fasciculata TaxID=261658 RepID=F4PR22_CACFS|nr:Proline iminopeptidase [Cavenderia fasciculata]EGG22079.1 Proline iminopeptidase [Cavenderia fasciculata]|eukprot:XP_004359930.1 Proline iminopeptidase [Cavenderia fasciculata]